MGLDRLLEGGGLRGGCLWSQPVHLRYQLFLSGEGKVSCGFRYLKNHPAEAVMKKPKPKRRITAARIPRAIVSMLPPWSFAVLCPGCRCRRALRNDHQKLNSTGTTLRLSLQS